MLFFLIKLIRGSAVGAGLTAARDQQSTYCGPLAVIVEKLQPNAGQRRVTSDFRHCDALLGCDQPHRSSLFSPLFVLFCLFILSSSWEEGSEPTPRQWLQDLKTRSCLFSLLLCLRLLLSCDTPKDVHLPLPFSRLIIEA